MPDAICRWRNTYLETVKELIEILPKLELTKAKAREIVQNTSPYDFYRTPYQLACQLGLYHETDGFYYPKFKYTPTDKEINDYLKHWITHYTVPNPYTRSLPNNIEPFSIHARICQHLTDSKSELNWEDVLQELFGIDIGNKDILKNSLQYSPVFEIVENTIRLKEGITYEDLSEYINVDMNFDRENKEYFFDLFDLPNDLTLPINEEVNLINEINNSTNYSETEKNQIVKARIGQGYFRRSLIESFPYCPITLVDDVNLLIASHIKPWKKSSNNERLDVMNGILLTPTVDKLFDKGYITFTDEKKLLTSPLISDDIYRKLQIEKNTTYPKLPINGREPYFEYHRENIFKSQM